MNDSIGKFFISTSKMERTMHAVPGMGMINFSLGVEKQTRPAQGKQPAPEPSQLQTHAFRTNQFPLTQQPNGIAYQAALMTHRQVSQTLQNAGDTNPVENARVNHDDNAVQNAGHDSGKPELTENTQIPVTPPEDRGNGSDYLGQAKKTETTPEVRGNGSVKLGQVKKTETTPEDRGNGSDYLGQAKKTETTPEVRGNGSVKLGQVKKTETTPEVRDNGEMTVSKESPP
jgi:hypothetical protein